MAQNKGTPPQVKSHMKLATSPPQTTQTPNSLDISTTHLIIPAIQLNAPIESVGLLPTGNLGVPIQRPWDAVGWYLDGPLPGQVGSSIIDGHLDRPGGAPAVFWNLQKLHVGDQVMVQDAKGYIQHFRVTKTELYTPNSAPLNAIFNNNSGSFLNLITCAGAWIPAQHQTTMRLVVYTTLVT